MDDAPITSQEALDAALAEVGFPPGCPRLALFASNSPYDYAADGRFDNQGSPEPGDDCFRFTEDGHLIFNLQLSPDTFVRGVTYEAGVRLNGELLSPKNRFFQVR